jgi:ATP-binding cassette subfamily F protein 3
MLNIIRKDGPMSLVDVQNLSVSFSGKTIFKNVGFQLAEGNRVGLIGPNGSGKTTLLRILADEMSAETGNITFAKGSRIGYLRQDIEEGEGEPVLFSVLNSVDERPEVVAEIQLVEDKLAHTHDEAEQMELAQLLAELHDKNNHIDLKYPPYEAEQILAGLGFSVEEFEKNTSVLSGGWRMRVALAKLLYQKPEILLMDEPTNHLDIPSVHWLEGFLSGYCGAIVLVCHDRDFLNRQVSKIMSFEPEGVRQYSGNYDFYLLAREEERRILEGKVKNQDRQVREAKRFIDRFKAKATKARQAQSRIKMLDKMDLIETHSSRKTINFSFPSVDPSGRHVLSVEGLKKSFGDNELFDDLNLSVTKGDRIAIIGPNGSGKTTLLRIIANELKADKGTVTFGQNVSLSYFAQHHSEDLIMSNTVVEEVHRSIPSMSVGYVRNVCGAFLFSGDDVDKNVQVLSGGEKARVALARTLVKKGNFMIMDEPTNHLDIDSTEILIEALKNYEGTLLFVSHNQSFVNSLSTCIWDLKDGTVNQFPGSLYEYYEFMERRAKLALLSDDNLEKGGKAGKDKSGPSQVESSDKNKGPKGASLSSKGANQGSGPSAQVSNGSASQGSKSSGKVSVVSASSNVDGDELSRKELRRLEAEKRQQMSKVLGPLKNRLSKIEKRISEYEKREKELEDQLSDPEVFGNTEVGGPLLKEFGDVRMKLTELMSRWEFLQDELAQKEAAIN